MFCPHCEKYMGWNSHGVCQECKKNCGCSFNPTSENDFCDSHKSKFKTKENKTVSVVFYGPDDEMELFLKLWQSEKLQVKFISNNILEAFGEAAKIDKETAPHSNTRVLTFKME